MAPHSLPLSNGGLCVFHYSRRTSNMRDSIVATSMDYYRGQKYHLFVGGFEMEGKLSFSNYSFRWFMKTFEILREVNLIRRHFKIKVFRVRSE